MTNFFEIRDVFKKYPDMSMYIIFGERSNGKTYSALDYVLENYAKHGWQGAYIRRSKEDVKTKITSALYANHIQNGRFEKFFGSFDFPYNAISQKGDALYPVHVWFTDKGVRKRHSADNPILICSALSTWQHSKGISFPNVKTIIFDEFLTNGLYLPDEVNTFQQLLSSFVRERGDVKVVLLGNTVSRYSPYFTELGLLNVESMKPGETQVYTSGDKQAKYLVMLTGKSGGKASDKYFSVFNNETSAMIRGGAWELSAYPIITKGMLESMKVYETFFISFAGKLIRCVIYLREQAYFVFTPARYNMMFNEDNTRTTWYKDKVVFTDFLSLNSTCRYNMLAQKSPIAKLMITAMEQGRAYYSNNETGDTVSNYLKWCRTQGVV